jgi:DNA-binding GntR family transcriptional regulator
LAPGQRVRAEKDYEQEHGISRDTVRKAIDILRHEGLLVTARSGSHVRGRMDLTAVRVERGVKILARMPSEQERRELGIEGVGIPIFIIKIDGQENIHPADRTVIEFD